VDRKAANCELTDRRATPVSRTSLCGRFHVTASQLPSDSRTPACAPGVDPDHVPSPCSGWSARSWRFLSTGGTGDPLVLHPATNPMNANGIQNPDPGLLAGCDGGHPLAGESIRAASR